MPRYWLLFANRFVQFRDAEVAALWKIAGCPLACSSTSEQAYEKINPEQPFCVVDLPSEAPLRSLLGRGILLRYICELWACAKTYSDLFKNLKDKLNLYEPYMNPQTTFKIQVESFGKFISHEYKIQRIEETLGQLPLKGKIDLSNAENTFQIFEYYGSTKNACEPDAAPLAIYFGRLIGRGQCHVPETYSVKNRMCIGNTTMDATLSFLMANIAAIHPGSLVCDPFVGTGSLLLSAAHFGAYCVGTEINYNILHGLGKSSRAFAGRRKPGENLAGNFKQYGLENRLLGACLADASRHDLWRRESIFDAIITDPPYGIREKSTKVGMKPGKEAHRMSAERPNEHYPMKTKYSSGDVFLDLLNFSADYLVVDGRLVYWLPVFYQTYSDEVIPKHPRLRLMANCEQRLTGRYGRRLIVMEKTKDHNSSTASEEECREKAYYTRDCYSDVRLRDLVMNMHASDNETGQTSEC